MKTIVITGASSGIGKATAKLFAEKGWQVAATMRNPMQASDLEPFGNLQLFALDVTDPDSIRQAVERILAGLGAVDLVVNNAGYALAGPFEATTSDQVFRQFNTNVFGLMDVTRAFLPHFRERKSGLFINVSSVGGLSTYPFSSLYHATKWAVEGFTESLSYELGELGIQVKLIEPGAVATDFGGRSMEFAMPENQPEYGPVIHQFMSALAKANRIPATAEEIASGIFEAATDNKKQLRYPVGDAAQIFALRKQLGDDAFLQFMREQMLSK